MLKFQEKRKIRGIFYSKIIVFVLLIINVFLLNAVFNVYRKREITKENLLKTATVFSDLESRETMLSSEIERLKTDHGIEEEIRDRYGMVKDNEEVITIINDRNKDPVLNNSSASFWGKILGWFK